MQYTVALSANATVPLELKYLMKKQVNCVVFRLEKKLDVINSCSLEFVLISISALLDDKVLTKLYLFGDFLWRKLHLYPLVLIFMLCDKTKMITFHCGKGFICCYVVCLGAIWCLCSAQCYMC